MKKRPVVATEDLFEEVVAIKRLFVFALLRSGANQTEVAAALGTSQSQTSKMFPTRLGSPSRNARPAK
jgi:hypothetical protein